jgi:hypothetical protein
MRNLNHTPAEDILLKKAYEIAAKNNQELGSVAEWYITGTQLQKILGLEGEETQ